MKKKSISLTTQVTISIILLVIVANAMLGIFMMIKTRQTMKAQISERMLDISNTAADFLNGDVLEKLTAKDEYTINYKAIQKKLTIFRDNINLEYIYCIKDMGNKNFVFSVDPSLDDPAEFGTPVAYTDALYAASLGTAAVDEEPYTDAWGTFYSAYSPVFNSKGEVAGIVAVDFSAEWFNAQIRSSVYTILISTVMSLVIGGLLVIYVTIRIRKRFKQLGTELSELSVDIDMLTRDLDENADGGSASAAAAEDDDKISSPDDISKLSKRLHATHDELKRYINHLNTREKNMITALASDYRSLYYVDLETDSGICYRSGSGVEESIVEGEAFEFSKWFGDYANKYITDDYRDEILRVIRADVIREQLRNEPIITCQFLANRDGRERYEMLRIAGVRHPEDQGENTVNEISIGITDVDRETRESMNRNRALSEALAVANESSKAKTVFLSSMSHEIRTPMNAIIGLDTIALNDPEISVHAKEFFSKIGVSARHLLNLINDILDMSRIESGRMTLKKEEFSLEDVLEQVNTIIGEQCRDKQITYTCKTGKGVASYYIGDEIKLKQIMINILGNAVKFTPDGGEVELAVELAEHYENNSTLRFSMRDTGIGMDKEFIPKIFEAFSQEDSSFTTRLGSTGLGMAITKRIVDMMNGLIEVESEKGKGTTFFVTLTLIDSDRAEEPEETVDLKALNVLIIEPDSVSRDCAHLVMETLDVNADLIPTLEKALSAIKIRKENDDAYNLVILDRDTAEGGSASTVRSIRSAVGDEAHIILITDDLDELTEEEVQAGADGLLSKPIYADDIISELKRVSQHRSDISGVLAQEATLKGKTILVAEDTPINAEIMTMLLNMREMTADIAENGRIAVEKFSSYPPGHYAAILMDMRMPEMDGLTATTVIRAMDRPDAAKIPISALTANAFDEDVQRSLQGGLNAHLSKPVDPDKLFSILEKAVIE